MMLSHTDYPKRRGHPSRGFDEPNDRICAIRSMTVSAGENTEVLGALLAETERVVRPRQPRLQIARDGVDLLELRQISWLELTHHKGRVGGTCVRDTSRAFQTDRDDDGAGRRMHPGRLNDGLTRTHRDWAEVEVDGVALVVGADRSHEGHFVGRPSLSPCAIDFAPKIGFIDPDMSTEPFLIVSISHRRRDLVVHQPCSREDHAKLAFERERRQAILGLADQLDGEKPGGQRQLGAGEQRAGGDRGLAEASIALEQSFCIPKDDAVGCGSAGRTGEPVRPFHSRQRVCAARLNAKVANEVRQRRAGLEFDRVAGHDGQSSSRGRQNIECMAHRASLAEHHCEPRLQLTAAQQQDYRRVDGNVKPFPYFIFEQGMSMDRRGGYDYWTFIYEDSFVAGYSRPEPDRSAPRRRSLCSRRGV